MIRIKCEHEKFAINKFLFLLVLLLWWHLATGEFLVCLRFCHCLCAPLFYPRNGRRATGDAAAEPYVCQPPRRGLRPGSRGASFSIV